MDECVDGEYQTFKANDGAYVREHFFGRYPETKAMVADWTDDEIWALRRGGHDPKKVYAAYDAAVRHTGQPTVILAKTIKGYGMGQAGEGRNITHQQKSMNEEARLAIRDRLGIPLTDEQATGAFFYRPPEDSPELRHMLERREALGGSLPARHTDGRAAADAAAVRRTSSRGAASARTRRRWRSSASSTRSSATRCSARASCRSCPTSHARSGWRACSASSGSTRQVGQLYEPEDAGDFMFYREDQHGQILQEGINEAGAFSSWLAAATSYANHGTAMIPFYVFYSMFGFQRVGDLAWAAGDSRARGFLIGGTAGRTTLNGEGLQHEDGHSHLLASVIPNCVAYDPTYAYEVAVIVRDGLRRMLTEQEDVFYYLTVMNENYPHPPLPEGAEEGILRGLYLLREAPRATGRACSCSARARSCARSRRRPSSSRRTSTSPPTCGARRASPSCVGTGWRSSAGTCCTRPSRSAAPWVEECLAGREGPAVAATDYIRAYADQIRPYVPGRYVVLGTDGFGRSDYRVKLRQLLRGRPLPRRGRRAEGARRRGRDRAVRRRLGDRALRDRHRAASPVEALSA